MKEGERMTQIVQPLRSGQITIPAEFRKRLGITEESLLKLTLEGGALRIIPLDVREKGAGAAWVKELYDLFAPVRHEASAASEDEVNQAIDAAIGATRKEYV
jgi:AbrB family looped-hinge helix DNA binding protein